MDERERNLKRQRAYRKRKRRLVRRIKLISLLVLFLAVIGTGVGIYSHWVEVEKANCITGKNFLVKFTGFNPVKRNNKSW